jgi:hypothetical protein
MLSGAESRLASSLSSELVAGFDFLSFAIDTEVASDGIINGEGCWQITGDLGVLGRCHRHVAVDGGCIRG